MSTLNLLLVIGGMFLVTYGIRVTLFMSAQKTVMPLWLDSCLKYVPVAVLTAIIMPMMLLPSGEINLGINNPWLIGGLVSFFVGVVFKKQLLTITLGVIAFFAAKLLMSL
ncbi:AzlD domain-containing protein [Marinomonas mediterranea]|jgi:Predicted membrane protein|uniref:Branched-chain amino acid transport n=1 Tax=Marinomonas mediterranea (strain ATCC 700492 / JCM 21426 / NBRC 103028 / MMB-1) TaxID=717774 RepID=F2JTI6_MARM1|nr:AzlD domain-containing protein [Marinomonas mediterranea]ADZ91500.1 branched-chain amino acid transport [Marinomonas mediterranea MMB-1]WCN09467.1 AzlD domain-containing protein [Marinomonas mediterranea]WCN13543.1 AzlD domain-containing protein [Marinomonas mediterranea]WCN17609.1 AzlD domain-containing protein [Marinomonas mediterranea MMB-1]